MKSILILFVLMFAFACHSAVDKKINANDGSFKVKEYKYVVSDELSKYIEGDISYFQVQGESDLVNIINNKVLYIYQGMAEGIPENPNDLIDAYMQKEAADIKAMIKEIGESAAIPYEFDYHARVVMNTDRLFSFVQEFNEYTGGAHSIRGKMFVNYDTKTEKEIHLTMLFDPQELKGLNELGEKAFREATKIPLNQSLEEAGYSFDSGFVLPNDFLISKNGLKFYFAPYEIGPYSLGDVTFTISYDKIRTKYPKSKLFYYID